MNNFISVCFIIGLFKVHLFPVITGHVSLYSLVLSLQSASFV